MCVNVLSCTRQRSLLCVFACLLWFNTPLCVCICLFCLYMGLFCLNIRLVGLYIGCIHVCLCAVLHTPLIFFVRIRLSFMIWYVSLCAHKSFLCIHQQYIKKSYKHIHFFFSLSVFLSHSLTLIFFFGKTLDVCLQLISCILSWFFFCMFLYFSSVCTWFLYVVQMQVFPLYSNGLFECVFHSPVSYAILCVKRLLLMCDMTHSNLWLDVFMYVSHISCVGGMTSFLVAVWHSVLQCCTVCCMVLQCGAVWCSVV